VLVATAAGRSPSWRRSGSTSSTFAAFAAAASGLRLSCSGSPAWSLADRVDKVGSEFSVGYRNSVGAEPPALSRSGRLSFFLLSDAPGKVPDG
jgi:hypothetical protein